MTPKAPKDCWELAEQVIQHSRTVLLEGPPGTGKSRFGKTACLQKGQKVYSVTLTEEHPAAEFRGFYIPKGDKFEWVHGVGILAWVEGARLVIDEIDRSGPDLQSFFLALLDDEAVASYTLPTGITVRPKSGFQVVATMNGDSRVDLPAALADRFPVCLNINRINPNAVKALPEDLRLPAESSIAIEDERRQSSVRRWFAYSHLRDKLDSTVAAQAVFGSSYKEVLASLKAGEMASSSSLPSSSSS